MGRPPRKQVVRLPRGPQAAAKQALEAAAVAHIAAHLLAVENNVPASALSQPRWEAWVLWRRALAAAVTVAQLTPLVRRLRYRRRRGCTAAATLSVPLTIRYCAVR